MIYKILGLAALAFLTRPMVANAQVTNLDYEGTLMSGGDRLTGFITFNGSGTVDASNVTSYQFDVTGVGEITSFVNGLGNGPFADISFTTANGAVAGAVVNWDDSHYGGSSIFDTSFSIGPQGDSYSNTQSGGLDGECIPYCGTIESSAAAGVWTVARAPEIDPASATSGLTLLLGGLTVLRGRRKLES